MIRPTFTITVRHVGDGDPVRALRSALKTLWRGYRLKCVDVREVEQPQQDQPDGETSRPVGRIAKKAHP